MITIQQVKAARALLNWKQEDLAEAAHLSLTAVNNLERGIGKPRSDTLGAIQQAFEKAGIEFTALQGVQFRGETFDMLKFDGPEFILRLTDDMLSFLRGPEDEVLMIGVEEEKFVFHDREQTKRYQRAARDRNFRERILVRDGDINFVSAPARYRWISEDLFGKVPYLIYGDTVAIVMWNLPQRTILLRNKPLADTFRQQFEHLWSIAGVPNKPGKILLKDSEE